MPVSLYSYPSYYHAPSHRYSAPSSYADLIPLLPQDYDMSQDHSLPHLNQQPPSPSIPIDPSLSLYSPYYHSYQQPQQQQHLPSHLSIAPNYSSPSSQGSDTIGTPPIEHMYPTGSSNSNGKRPASAISTASGSEGVKKARKDDESSEARSPTAEKEAKPKPTRGSR